MTYTPETLEQRINDLCESGKAKGFVTYTDVMNQLNDLDLDPDQLESIIDRLEAAGVRIVEQDVPASDLPEELASEDTPEKDIAGAGKAPAGQADILGGLIICHFQIFIIRSAVADDRVVDSLLIHHAEQV